MPDLEYLGKFIPAMELAALREHLKGEESKFFVEMLDDLEKKIRKMPGLHDKDAKGLDVPVVLHYFLGGSDWWIAKLDPGEMIGLGFARLGGMEDCAEIGEVYIPEIMDLHHGPFQVELDLYWNGKTLQEIMKEHEKNYGYC